MYLESNSAPVAHVNPPICPEAVRQDTREPAAAPEPTVEHTGVGSNVRFDG